MCLDCVKYIVDEIIIVDTGLTDETKDNVEKAVYHYKKAYEINSKNEYISKNEEFFNG